jgi:hypothetical protein
MSLDANGNIDIAWLQSANGVFFRRSTDGGATFSNTTVVQVNAEPKYLQMGLDAAGSINLLWWTPAGPFGGFVAAFFSRSIDGGLTFSTPTNLSPNLGGIQSLSPQLVVDPSGNVDIFWFDFVNPGLFFIRSTEGDANFSAPVKVWSVVGDGFNLRAASGSKGQVYIFWTREEGAQCDILFSRSIDSGATFSSAANISNAPGACSTNPKPLVDSRGNINVVWLTNGKSVSFSRSTDAGATFSAPKNVAGTVQFFSVSGQQIAVEPNGEIDIVWSAVLSEVTVLFARSDDNGATFSTPTILSLPPRPNMTGAGDPAIGVDPCGNISVAWEDDSVGSSSGEFDIFFKRSTDGGTTFSNPVDLSNTPYQAEVFPQIAVDSRGNTYLVWETTHPPLNVFFSRVADSSRQTGDFRISVSPKSQSAVQGDVLRFEVAAYAVAKPGQVANLSCSDLPPSATCTFNPPSVTARHSRSVANMTVTIPANEFPGTYLFAVNGVGGSTTDTQTVELIVRTPGDPLALATSVTAAVGTSSDFTTLNSQSALAGTAQLACSSVNESLCDALDPNWRNYCLNPRDIAVFFVRRIRPAHPPLHNGNVSF